MADQRIADYVKSCMDSGVPLNRIRSDLYKAGWQKGDIEEAIASVSGSPLPAARQEKIPAPRSVEKIPGLGPDRKKFYLGLIIIIASVGIGTFYLVSYIYSGGEPFIPASGDVCGDGNCTGQETYELCPADCPAPGNPADLQVGINPPSKSINSGDSLTFQVEISGVSNLYGFQFNLNYDPALLQFASAQEGTFLKGSGASTFCIEPKVVSGAAGNYVTIACTRTGAVGGVNGNGLLESVTFSALASGTAQPILSNIKLVDSSAQKISMPS